MQDYLLHRLRANNRHGIHSPFVYNLIDTVIYDHKSPEIIAERERRAEIGGLKPKAGQLLYRLAKHFKPTTILTTGKAIETATFYIKKAVPDAKVCDISEDISADMIVINAGYEYNSPGYFEQSLAKIHDDTIVVLTHIYQNRQAKQTWEHIKANERVRITIDLFYFGLVFFKAGRAQKEHFKVKY